MSTIHLHLYGLLTIPCDQVGGGSSHESVLSKHFLLDSERLLQIQPVTVVRNDIFEYVTGVLIDHIHLGTRNLHITTVSISACLEFSVLIKEKDSSHVACF